MLDWILPLLSAAAPAALIAGAVAVAASIQFLRSKNFFYDALALAATEAGWALLAVGIVAGVVQARTAGSPWWTWDARLTAALVCWLLYAAYLMLRQAIEEPTQRATAAAVVSILAFLDIPIVFVAVQWWRTRHAGPAGTGAGFTLLSWNLLPVVALGAVIAVFRLRREQRRRELDAERRAAFAL